jgi:LuxR family transcriptional regulator, maltose regulon positive regulatory protein
VLELKTGGACGGAPRSRLVGGSDVRFGDEARALSATAALSGPVLVATKLHVPEVRPGLVPRRDLLARLVDDEGRKLTLLCAPAGWGKTVLLSEWYASAEEGRPFAWVSLDRGDDDVARFWGYVVGALRTVAPDLGRGALATLPAAGPGLVDAVVGPLINELAQLPSRVVLVLDDYHLVREEPIHASVGFLLRHLPDRLHVAIASRSDPPLPLGALRAGGEILEVRAAELRFSDAEADALLNGSLGLGLDRSEVELLQARTEGWAAGLQLAALSLRGQEDKRALVETFAGDDRQIGDYLHEVLTEQPAPLREFLLRTSILERLCAPLCDALTGGSDGPRSWRRSIARTCSWCRWTRAASGTAITTSFVTCSYTSSSAQLRVWWPSCTGALRFGIGRRGRSTGRLRMRRRRATSATPQS